MCVRLHLLKLGIPSNQKLCRPTFPVGATLPYMQQGALLTGILQYFCQNNAVILYECDSNLKVSEIIFHIDIIHRAVYNKQNNICP